jgi:hypothetical protein
VRTTASQRGTPRPPEVLGDVGRGREPRAPPSEQAAQQHHRGCARLRTGARPEAEEQVAEHGADHHRDERGAERQRGEPGVGREDERAGDDQQQADAEVAPQRRLVEEPERAGRRLLERARHLLRAFGHRQLPSPA